MFSTVKVGYKHKTGAFGADSERFASSLFLMLKNPNGDRRPDLVSVNGRYDPRISIELKSGKAKKGVMVAYQLHYAINSHEDYERLFNSKFKPSPVGLFKDADWEGTYQRLSRSPIAYYYNVIDRVDGVGAKELDRSFSTIKLRWGDQHIVPHEYAFNAFAVARHMRTGENLENIVEDLKRIMKEDIDTDCSNYKVRKEDVQSWQNINGRDMLALYHNDESMTTEHGKTRIELIRELYPKVDNLKRIKIPGPNDTSIYVLAEEQHYGLFNENMREVVGVRRPVIEQVTRVRERSLNLLNRIEVDRTDRLGLLDEDIADEGEFGKSVERVKGLERSDLRKLARIVRWQGYNDGVLEDLYDQSNALKKKLEDVGRNGNVEDDEIEAIKAEASGKLNGVSTGDEVAPF